MNLILKSKSKSDLPIKVGDQVQVFIKLQNEKRGKWSSPNPVLSYDRKSGTVILPGKNGRKINAAIEDILLAIRDNDLAIKYQESIEKLDMMLNNTI